MSFDDGRVLGSRYVLVICEGLPVCRYEKKYINLR